MKQIRKIVSCFMIVVMLLSMTAVAAATSFDNITGGGTYEPVEPECNHVPGRKEYYEQPTCVERADWAAQCIHCGAWMDGADYGPHSWSSWQDDGYGGEWRQCTVCGETEERAGSSSADDNDQPSNNCASGNHSWGGWKLDEEPTCTERGLEYKK